MVTRKPNIKGNFVGIEFSGNETPDNSIRVNAQKFERMLRSEFIELRTLNGDPLDALGIQRKLDTKELSGPIMYRNNSVVFKPTQTQQVFLLTQKA